MTVSMSTTVVSLATAKFAIACNIVCASGNYICATLCQHTTSISIYYVGHSMMKPMAHLMCVSLNITASYVNSYVVMNSFFFFSDVPKLITTHTYTGR